MTKNSSPIRTYRNLRPSPYGTSSPSRSPLPKTTNEVFDTSTKKTKKETECHSTEIQSTGQEALITEKIRAIQGDYIKTAQSVLKKHPYILEMNEILQRMAHGTYPTKLKFCDSVAYGNIDFFQEQYTAARDSSDLYAANNIYRSVFNLGCRQLVIDKWALAEVKGKLPPAYRYL